MKFMVPVNPQRYPDSKVELIAMDVQDQEFDWSIHYHFTYQEQRESKLTFFLQA
jgi:hypothetical protein